MQLALRKTLAMAAALMVGAAAAHAHADEEKFVVVKAGRIITGAGEDITGGEIVIVDGKVRLVGRKLEYPASAAIIDASNETVIPGLINARSRPAELADYNRSGVRADLKASADIYPGQIDFEPYLRAGFTTVAIYPPGIQAPGLASVYHTAGAEAKQPLGVPGYLRMTMNSQPRDKGTLRDAIKKAKAEIEKVDKAKQEFEAKKKEAEAKKKAEAEKPAEPPKEQPGPPSPAPAPTPPGPPAPGPAPQPAPSPQGPPRPTEPTEFKPPEMDPTHRPFIDHLQKKAGAPALLLELNKASDYLHAADVLEDAKEIRRNYYLGGFATIADFNYVVPQLGEEKALVAMPAQMYRMPSTVTRFNLAGDLIAAGASVAFVPANDSLNELETLRAKAADLARAGVERPDAIKALTINNARLLGAEKQIGSIEKGKLADLTFLSGDILDPGARVTRVMINGEIVWTSEEGRK